MMRVVLASNNAKKLSELQALLASVPVTLVTQGSLGIAEAEEPHHTFIENALAKARHAAQACGGPPWLTTQGCACPRWAGPPESSRRTTQAWWVPTLRGKKTESPYAVGKTRPTMQSCCKPCKT